MPDSLEVLEEGAFNSCKSLDSITIPEKITELAPFLFGACYSLKEVSYGRITSFGEACLGGCPIEGELDIPEYVTHIGRLAFAQTNIRNLRFRKIPESIGEEAFSGCKNLWSVTADSGSFHSLPKGIFKDCSNLYRIVPSIYGSIPDYAFENCKTLGSLPFYLKCYDVTSIGRRAFYGCSTEFYCRYDIDFENVTSIGEEAFAGCKVGFWSSLELVNENIEIGNGVFSNADISSCRFKRKKPNFASNETFPAGTTIYVPLGCKDAYSEQLPYCHIEEEEDSDAQIVYDFESWNKPDYKPLLSYNSTQSNCFTDASQIRANVGCSDGVLDNLLNISGNIVTDKETLNENQTYHCLQLDAKKGHKVYEIEFATNSEYMDTAPTKVHKFMTNTPEDESSWIDCGTDTLVYRMGYYYQTATTNVKHYDKMRYIRLQVEATKENLKENGNLYFSLTRLQVFPVENARGVKWDDGLYKGLSNVSSGYNQDFLSGNSYIDNEDNNYGSIYSSDTTINYRTYFECDTKPIKNLVIMYSRYPKKADDNTFFYNPEKFILLSDNYNWHSFDSALSEGSEQPQVYSISFGGSVSHLNLAECGDYRHRLENANKHIMPLIAM